MTLSVAKDYLERNIRCNLSPAHVQIPFVDGQLKRTCPGKQPRCWVSSGLRADWQNGNTEQIGRPAAYFCSDLTRFLTGADIPFDGARSELTRLSQ